MKEFWESASYSIWQNYWQEFDATFSGWQWQMASCLCNNSATLYNSAAHLVTFDASFSCHADMHLDDILYFYLFFADG